MINTKDVFEMKKSSYLLLYFACFALIFVPLILSAIELSASLVAAAAITSMFVSLIPYLLMILIVRIVSSDAKES